MTGVVTVGECMACATALERRPLRLGGSLALSVAGAEANVAIGLARLGHRVRFIGRVGDDELGRLVERTLRAEAVEADLQRDPGAPTGLFLKEPRVDAITRVHYYRAGSAGSRIEPAQVSEDAVRAAAMVYVSGITPALGTSAADTVRRLIEIAVACGVPVAFGINWREQLWPSPGAGAGALAELARAADHVIGSGDELRLIAGGRRVDQLVDDLLAGRARTVVATHGAAGAESFSSAGSAQAPALPVTAVDTVGAGDAFTAGYLSALLDGQGAEPALRRGARVAAFAVGTRGDWEGLPERSELELLALEPGATVR
jgi:2-dehydro-3-deoxygluconokinase